MIRNRRHGLDRFDIAAQFIRDHTPWLAKTVNQSKLPQNPQTTHLFLVEGAEFGEEQDRTLGCDDGQEIWRSPLTADVAAGEPSVRVSDYRPRSISWSNRKRIFPVLPPSEITNRTFCFLEVLA